MAETQTFQNDGDIYFKNTRGKNIFCKYWNDNYDNNKQPKALVFIVHGIGEHCQRYRRMADHMTAELDCFVFSHDHHGHGKSEGTRVHTTNFSFYVDDIVQHVAIVRKRFPEPPLFLLAHSMGGTVALLTVLDHPKLCTALAMISPALKFNPKDVPRWKIFSVKMVAKVLPYLTIGSVGDNTMCHDQAERDDFDNDPLNHHKGLRAGWATHFHEAMQQVLRRAGEITLPLFTIHGDGDEISPVEGSEELHDNMKDNACHELKVVPGAYHEVHLEPNGVGKACLDDISEFFSQRLAELNTEKATEIIPVQPISGDSIANKTNGIESQANDMTNDTTQAAVVCVRTERRFTDSAATNTTTTTYG